MAMIPLTHMAGKTVGVLGLGASGLATAKALTASGAHVHVWDDKAAAREHAASEGLTVADLTDDALDALVPSPGIPMTHPAPHPMIAAARKRGAQILGDVELFAQARSALPAHKVVSITGTNGKSTTTALVAHMLNAAGRKAVIGGNFGPPILSLDACERVYVLELSSFQLEQTYSLASDIAVFLNLTPDHGDRYASMATYGEAKQSLFDMQGANAAAVIAIDDAEGLRLAGHAANSVVPVSGAGADGAQWRVAQGALLHDGTQVSAQADWPALKGPHNAQNAAAAAATCSALGLSHAEISSGLASYEALAHRSQPVGHIGQVQFINDSKATNPDATAKSLQAYDSIHWLAGGSDKGSDFAMLGEYAGGVEAAYFFGQTRSALASALPDLGAHSFETLQQAFASAAAAAQSSGKPCTVLLSPACASFDQFKSFADRGNVFTALVSALKQEAA